MPSSPRPRWSMGCRWSPKTTITTRLQARTQRCRYSRSDARDATEAGRATNRRPVVLRCSFWALETRVVTILRMDNVGIVVEDLAAAIAFFAELGLELEGEAPVEGPWADRVVGLDDVRVDIAMMRTPDGHSRVELTKFHSPAAVNAEPRAAPANTVGIRRIMFAVDDIEDAVARLRSRGELVGEVAQYEESYLLCYVRGPEGIIVGLAEELG